MRCGEIQKVLIVAGVAIIVAGFVLHALTPLPLYGLYYRNVPLGFRTIVPALTYGMSLLLTGVAYSRAGRISSIALMVILFILSNVGFTFAIHDFLTTPYGPELAFEVYFFIAQTLTYPWIVANIAGIFYFLSKHFTS